jgi:hypothetical protein
VRRTDGQIKILDFGLARMDAGPGQVSDTRLTEAGFVLGTPGYMAPEQLAGRDADARVDIFAFGVLGWELATGEHPFGANPAALVTRMVEMMEGRTAPLSRPLPLPGLDRIARRCMRARREERYPTSADLLADLRALTQSGGMMRSGSSPDVAALPEPAAGSALWWWRFHQAAIAALATAMPFAAFVMRRWPPAPYGSWIFYAVLTLATLSVTLRLNLVFASRVHPATLIEHRARLFPAIAAADALLAAVLLSASAIVSGAHDEMAAVLLVVAIVLLASLFLVEPATTRAAGITPPSDPL